MIRKFIGSCTVFTFAAAALFSLAAPLGACAGEYTQGGITLTYSVSGNEAAILGCSGEGTSVIIPEMLESTYTVTSISSSAFADCTSLISVTVPDSISVIEDNAFFGCTSLEKVYLGSAVAFVGDYAFAACPKLDAFSVSASNTAFSSVEGMLYNADGTMLAAYAGENDAVIPQGTVSIGKGAFFGNTLLSSVSLPAGLETIGDYAFSGCLSLTDMALPASVSKLGTGSFLSCTALSSVTLGAGLTAIPESCFSMCSSLEGVNIPSGVSSIGSKAFYSCPSLSGIYIPATVTSIGTDAVGTHYNIRNEVNEPIFGFYINGDKGSAAESYAKQSGVDFIDFSNLIAGDVDGNGVITASDAAVTLGEYASRAIGNPPSFTYYMELAADYNSNGVIEATDAALILAQYASSAVS